MISLSDSIHYQCSHLYGFHMSLSWNFVRFVMFSSDRSLFLAYFWYVWCVLHIACSENIFSKLLEVKSYISTLFQNEMNAKYFIVDYSYMDCYVGPYISNLFARWKIRLFVTIPFCAFAWPHGFVPRAPRVWLSIALQWQRFSVVLRPCD